MRITEDEYKDLVASMQARSKRALPISQPDPCTQSEKSNETKEGRKKESCSRFKLVVTARRVRAIDPDNIFVKWAIDELVKAGILPDDSATYIESIEKKIEVVRNKEQEETIIEVYQLDQGNVTA